MRHGLQPTPKVLASSEVALEDAILAAHGYRLSQPAEVHEVDLNGEPEIPTERILGGLSITMFQDSLADCSDLGARLSEAVEERWRRSISSDPVPMYS